MKMNKPKPIVREPILDYNDVIDYIEEKYNIDTRDYAGKFNGKGKKKIKELEDNWLEVNGYGQYKHVLNKPKGSKKDWEEGSEEIRIRVEINTRIRDEEKDWEEIVPYLDYWHWMLDNNFDNVSNGCNQYWGVMGILESETTPKWVKEITQLVYDEFKEYLDEDGGFEVYIWW